MAQYKYAFLQVCKLTVDSAILVESRIICACACAWRGGGDERKREGERKGQRTRPGRGMGVNVSGVNTFKNLLSNN